MDFKFKNKLLLKNIIKNELKAEPILSFVYSKERIVKIILLQLENRVYSLLGFHFYENKFKLYNLEYDTYINFTKDLFIFESKIDNVNLKLLLLNLKTIRDKLGIKELANEQLFEGIKINEFYLKLSHSTNIDIYEDTNNKITIDVVDSCFNFDKYITVNDLSSKIESLYLLSSVRISNSLKNVSLLNRAVISFNDVKMSFCCKQTFIEDDNINFIYIDMVEEEFSNIVTGVLTNIQKPHQLLDLMLRASEKKWDCLDSDNKNIHSFSIFMPIKNIKLESEINIGFTKFFNDNYDNDIKKFYEFVKIKNDNIIFAMTTIDSNTFYNAYDIGKANISLAFNIILSVLRTVYIYNISTNTKDNFNRDLLFPKPYFLDWIYIKNNSTTEFVILDANNMDKRTIMNVTENEIYKLEKIEELESIYLKKIDADCIITKNKNHNHINNTFNSLNWINKSWDSLVPVDKIVYSIIALEFLVSGVKIEPKLHKSISSKIKDEINSKIEYYINNKDTEFIGIDFENKDKEQVKCLTAFKDSVNNLFAMALDASFMTKFEYLVKSLNIPLEDFEFQLIIRARKIRNDIVHGRGNEFLNEIEIKQLNNIIIKIAHYKLIYHDWGI